MASVPTRSTSTTSILKCPSCNFTHHLKSMVSGKHFIQMNTAREIFGVTAECPVCLDECSGVMALQCGHILCKDDYQRLGGVMPTSFDSATREKIECDIFLWRSDATTTSSPLTLTFCEPGQNAPTTITTFESSEATTAAVAAYSSNFSFSSSMPLPFDPATRLRRTTEQLPIRTQPFFFGEANAAARVAVPPATTIGGFSGFAPPPIANGYNSQPSTVAATGSSGASRLQPFAFGEANAGNVLVPSIAHDGGLFELGAVRSLLQPRLDTNDSATSANGHSSHLIAARSSVVTNASSRIIQATGVRIAAPPSEPVGGLFLSEEAQPSLPTRRITRSASRVNAPSSDSAVPRRSNRINPSVPT